MKTAWRKFFDPQVLERLRGARLSSRRAADGLLVGSHRSPRSGQAVEFSEHRQYTPGDDLKNLDWKVLARTDKHYLRQREDETTLDCHLVLDKSGSMSFQGPQAALSKFEFALRVCAAVGFVAVENHDRVALSTIGETMDHCLGFGGGNDHLLSLALAMDRIQADEGAEDESIDLGARLVESVQSLPRNGLVVWISDLFDPVEGLVKALRAIRTSGRSVIVVQVYDPAEETFPFEGTYEFLGLEGEPQLTADARGVAAAYRNEFEKHQRELRDGCLHCEAVLWQIRSDQPLQYRLPELLSRL